VSTSIDQIYFDRYSQVERDYASDFTLFSIVKRERERVFEIQILCVGS